MQVVVRGCETEAKRAGGRPQRARRKGALAVLPCSYGQALYRYDALPQPLQMRTVLQPPGPVDGIA